MKLKIFISVLCVSSSMFAMQPPHQQIMGARSFIARFKNCCPSGECCCGACATACMSLIGWECGEYIRNKVCPAEALRSFEAIRQALHDVPGTVPQEIIEWSISRVEDKYQACLQKSMPMGCACGAGLGVICLTGIYCFAKHLSKKPKQE